MDRRAEGRDGPARALLVSVTTEANEAVRPVHAEAMPVLLTTAGDWDTWLTRPLDEAMALQKPLPDAMLRVVAAGDKTDGTKPA